MTSTTANKDLYNSQLIQNSIFIDCNILLVSKTIYLLRVTHFSKYTIIMGRYLKIYTIQYNTI